MLQLRNQFGQLDISVIDPVAVSELSDLQQHLLARLITAVEDRQAAQERFNSAVLAVRLAAQEQEVALEEHRAANPPQTFQQAQAAVIAAYNKSH
jgi:hypothetical protein